MAQGRFVIGITRQTVPAPREFARVRRRPLKQRLIVAVIALAIVLLALAGWAAQALRAAT
jgi:hypothetical protein